MSSCPENIESTSIDDFSILPEDLQKSLLEQGIQQPTDIQKASILPAWKGKDILAQSQTGSGKTLAFAIPVGLQLYDSKTERAPRALVLAPTRELATQVQSVFSRTMSCLKLRCMAVIGGDSYRRQQIELRKGVDIVVGTPGRVVDLIKKGSLDLNSIKSFVLDEVDQMLDIGFAPELEFIQQSIPKKKQTLFFSATMNHRMEEMAKGLLVDPVEIKTTTKQRTNENIQHAYFGVKPSHEMQALINILLYHNPKQALIFCETRQECRDVSDALESRGLNAAPLNSDLSQEARISTLSRFRHGKLQFLVATNVAARGIDIDSLPLVINFHLPYDVESYTHRTGRTGRAGESGKAWSIVTPHSFSRYHSQMRNLRLQPQRLELPNRHEVLSVIGQRQVEQLTDQDNQQAHRRIRRVVDRLMESVSPEESEHLLRGFLLNTLASTRAYDTQQIEVDDESLQRRFRRSSHRNSGRRHHGDRFRGSSSSGSRHSSQRRRTSSGSSSRDHRASSSRPKRTR